MNNLEKRILDISYKHKLSHLGSCLTSVNIIDEIFNNKDKDDVFILSNGHAGLALYTVLEKYHSFDAIDLFLKHGVHPNKDLDNKIVCSTGSLGMGLPIAIGFALANKNREVYCLISDGECAEGSIWESLSFIHTRKISNISVYVNINGFSAYSPLDKEYLIQKLKAFYPDIHIRQTNLDEFPMLKGLDAHYKVLTEEEYSEICKL